MSCHFIERLYDEIMALDLDYDTLDEDSRAFLTWDVEASPWNFGLVALVDPSTLQGEALVDYLRSTEGLIAYLTGRSHVAVARLSQTRPDDAPEVLASALEETVTTAGHRCAASARMVRVHQHTLGRLDRGVITARHAGSVERACRNLPAGVAQSVDAQVWAVTHQLDPAEAKRRALALALVIDPEAAAARAAKERAYRGVDVFPGADGIATLEAPGPVEDLVAVRDALNQGTAAPAALEDGRTRQQRIYDLMVKRITGRPASLSGGHDDDPAGSPCTCGGTRLPARRDRRVDVGITVPLDVVLGLREGPATIDGQPVPSTVALALLQTDAAVLRRLVTDPVTGHLLDAHPTTYQPGAALKRFIRQRDHECRWPGCHRKARRCDIDHREPFPAGPTTRANTWALCEHHHQLKHTHGWTFTWHPDGTATLHGPTGTTRRIEPWRTDGPIDYQPPTVAEAGPESAPEPLPAPVSDPDEEPPF
jgi:hypothetical protein